MKTRRISLRFLSLFLTVAILTVTLPLTVFATSASAQTASDQTAEKSTLADTSVLLTAEEDLTLREESVKHFRLEDGTYLAVQYPAPVHIRNGEGEWEDINNHLSDGGNAYTSEDARIKFAKKITGNGVIFTLHDGNRKLTVSLDGAVKKTEGVAVNTETAFDESTTLLQKLTTLDNLSTRVTYADILEGTDLEYVVDGLHIKENLYIKQPQDAYSFTFIISVNNLLAELLPDGSIRIYDPDTAATVYTVPAGYMYDAAGVCSDAVTYTLTDRGNGTYAMTVTPDASWINADGRQFPVCVDPPLYLTTASAYSATYINSNAASTNYGSASYLSVGNRTISFWRATLPSLPEYAYITSATYTTTASYVSGLAQQVRMHKVTSAWNKSTLTYSLYTGGAGAYESTYSDYVLCRNTTLSLNWDITGYVQDWYRDPATNYGVAMVSATYGNATAAEVRFAHTTNPAILCIQYQRVTGLENYWSYATAGAGTAGTGYVNLASGELSWVIHTLACTDALFGYTPTLVYQGYMANKFYTNLTSAVPWSAAKAGKGFFLSVNEAIVVGADTDNNDSTVNCLTWIDGDGTMHDFYLSSGSIYRDVDGMMMQLTVTDTGYTLTDANHVKRHFVTFDSTSLTEGSACLQYVEDKNGNRLHFVVNSSGTVTSVRLIPNGGSTITLLNLTYNSNGVLQRVTNPASGYTVDFYYSSTYNGTSIATTNNGYLRKIVRTYGSTTLTSTYEYTSTGYLRSACDQTGKYQVTVTGTSAITMLTEYAGASLSTVGQKLSFAYGVNNTTVRSSGTDDVLESGSDVYTVYTFDHLGRATGIFSYDSTGQYFHGATAGEYATQANVKNNLTTQTSFQNLPINYLTNGDFETVNTAASPSGLPNSPVTAWYSNSMTVRNDNFDGWGTRVLQAPVSAGGTSYVFQYVRLPEGPYTFSVDLECSNIPNTDITLTATFLASGVTHTQTVSTNDAWVAEETYTAALHFDVSASQANAVVELRISADFNGSSYSNAYLYFDNATLTETGAVGKNNLIDFGNFSSYTGGLNNVPARDAYTAWRTVSSNIVTTSEPFGAVLQLDDSDAEVTQAAYSVLIDDIAVNSVGFEQMLLLSGMAKGTQQILGDSGTFALRLRITYYLTETDELVTDVIDVPFIPDSTNWQFASKTVTTRAEIITRISVSCVYDGHPGTAQFDNISLLYSPDNFVTRYSYYDSGRMHVAKQGATTTVYEYDDNGNLTVVADSRGGLYRYAYDASNNLTEEIYCTYVCDDGFVGCYHYAASDPLSQITVTGKYRTTYTYNSYGLLTATRTKAGSYSATGTFTESGAAVTSSSTYEVTAGSKIFGARLTSTDSRGKVTRYFYDTARGLLLAVIQPDGTGMTYTYDDAGNLKTVLPATYSSSTGTYTASSTAESVTYTYDSRLWLTAVATKETTYHFSYNDFGQTLTVGVGSNTLVTNTYNPNGGKLTAVAYTNGFTARYVYNEREQVSEIYYTNGGTETLAFSYTYTSDGTLYRFEDHLNGTATLYRYDTAGRLESYVQYDTDSAVNTLAMVTDYNRNDLLSNLTYKGTYLVGSTTSTWGMYYTYTYNPDASLARVALTAGGATGTTNYTYDSLGRLTAEELTYATSTGTVDFTRKEEYTYLAGSSSSYTTGLVSTYKSTVGSAARTFTYTYDANGNITQAVDSFGYIACRYVYDDLGQLIREDNTYLNCTILYTYDNAGNLLTQKKYALTAAGTTPSGTYTSKTYTYGNSVWGDQLTKFGGTSITYDANGNPLVYYNGYTFTWKNGNELATATKGSTTLSFSYDDNGVRVRKTVGGVDHIYTVSGTQILSEAWDGNLLLYLYDASGAPIGMAYHGSSYPAGAYNLFFFETNLQGDVIAVYDEVGTKLLTYTYDAWGNCTEKTVSSTVNGTSDYAATYNPFRYRGYYYDTETSLYYLNSRYYDPNTGRFISADRYVSTGQGLVGHNMYAYCGNDPVNRLDPQGTFWACFFGDDTDTHFNGDRGSLGGTSSLGSALLAAGVCAGVLWYASNRQSNSLAGVDTIEKTNLRSKSYTVYVLVDAQRTVQYVGRTTNLPARELAHKSSHRSALHLKIIEENLTYSQARALEQTLMLYYHTLNRSNPINNQINGVSIRKWPYYRLVAIDFLKYWENQLSNELLNMLEG